MTNTNTRTPSNDDPNRTGDSMTIAPQILDNDFTVTFDRHITVQAWVGIDGALVVQVDTAADSGRLRINVNDAPVFDQDTETGVNYLNGATS